MSVFFLILGKSPSVGITAAFYINSFIKEYSMKNSIKLFGIISMALVIIFSMTGCPTDDGGDDGAGAGPGTTPQTPIAADYDIGSLARITGSNLLSGVSVTAKTGKSTGAVTVYYTGISPTVYAKSDTVPQAVGTYAVTFDVAAAAGWNAASGLPAGTLTITDPTLTGITADYNGPTAVDYTTPIDDFKNDLTVTAQYSNNTSKPVTDYELSGTLDITGASDITVTYTEGGVTKIDTFTVTAFAPAFTDVAAMTTFLGSQDSNTADTAYNIKLNVASLPWFFDGQAQTAFSDKFVNLDLSGSTLTTIGANAFSFCASLADITIPEGVTSIGQSAFYGCTGLTDITIPNSVTTISANAFYGCASLASVTIPNSVTTIGQGAFRDCTSLTGITIPAGVTSIGEAAFRSCTSLAGITIPEGVTSIGTSAFYGCTSLASVTIPASVTSIGTSAFYQCASLAGITIPEGVTSIGYEMFSGCTSLVSATIPDSVTSIGNLAFNGCTGLTSVTIPASVTSIGQTAFYGCTSLASVTIPEGVTSIGQQAFGGCTGLTSVTIPASLTTISNIAFSGCTNLASVTISEGVTSIGVNAFLNCRSLTSVTIPASVTTISSSAFKGCTSLARVTFAGTIDSGSFDNSTGENSAFPGDLRTKYFDTNGGIGTYTTTRATGDSNTAVWTKE
jgi:hypothetical protein